MYLRVCFVCILSTWLQGWYVMNIHLFNGPLSRITRVSRYQKGKTIWIFLKQEAVSGSGISWALFKSASHSRQITTPAPTALFFYRPDALPAAKSTASKHRYYEVTRLSLKMTMTHASVCWDNTIFVWDCAFTGRPISTICTSCDVFPYKNCLLGVPLLPFHI